jgi:type I restriction enzyme S subunit
MPRKSTQTTPPSDNSATHGNGVVALAKELCQAAVNLQFHRPDHPVFQRHFQARPRQEKCGHNECESRTLAATRDALLPKLLSSEIRAKDAEEFVGEMQ